MQRFNLLDIGTGSGILGLATLYHCGHYIDHAYLCDLSTDALDIAKQNHEKIFLQEDPSAYGTSPQRGGKGGVISFLHCSLLDHPALKQLFLSKQTDLHSSEKGAEGGLSNPNSTNPILLVANLPYIPDEMFATNADDHITKREPTMAFV